MSDCVEKKNMRGLSLNQQLWRCLGWQRWCKQCDRLQTLSRCAWTHTERVICSVLPANATVYLNWRHKCCHCRVLELGVSHLFVAVKGRAASVFVCVVMTGQGDGPSNGGVRLQPVTEWSTCSLLDPDLWPGISQKLLITCNHTKTVKRWGQPTLSCLTMFTI